MRTTLDILVFAAAALAAGVARGVTPDKNGPRVRLEGDHELTGRRRDRAFPLAEPQVDRIPERRGRADDSSVPADSTGDGSDLGASRSYAPNGARVVYASDAGGHEALWCVNGGHARTKLFAETPGPEDATTGSGTESPALSPDGKQVVYTAAGQRWTAAINGTNRKQLTATGGDEADWARG